MQQFLGLTLPLGDGAARALDVGTRARMAAIEKERTRPDVDRLIVLRRKVVIEADQQELFDLRVAIRAQRWIVRVRGIVAVRLDMERGIITSQDCRIAGRIAGWKTRIARSLLSFP